MTDIRSFEKTSYLEGKFVSAKEHVLPVEILTANEFSLSLLLDGCFYYLQDCINDQSINFYPGGSDVSKVIRHNV